nr:MAG TPA: hypothetical protein [Caudoviricetes sp.]
MISFISIIVISHTSFLFHFSISLSYDKFPHSIQHLFRCLL